MENISLRFRISQTSRRDLYNLGEMEDISPRSCRDLESKKHHDLGNLGETSVKILHGMKPMTRHHSSPRDYNVFSTSSNANSTAPVFFRRLPELIVSQKNHNFFLGMHVSRTPTLASPGPFGLDVISWCSVVKTFSYWNPCNEVMFGEKHPETD